MDSIIVVSDTVINLDHLVQSTQARFNSLSQYDLKATLSLSEEDKQILSKEHIRQILVFDNGEKIELFKPEDIASFLEQCQIKSFQVCR